MTKMSDRGIWTSASNAQADLLCPARHRMQKPYPESGDGFSEFGRHVHDAFCGRLPLEQLTPEERASYDDIAAVEAAALSVYFAGSTGWTVEREKRLWVNINIGPEINHSGQFDVAYRIDTRVLIVDYKSLWGKTPMSSVNQQLRDLAALYWANAILTEEIGVCIAQPPATRKPDICVYTYADIQQAYNDMCVRVVACHNPHALPVAGEIQCEHCRAKVGCDAYRTWAGTASMLPAQVLASNIANWSITDWQLFLDRYRPARKLIDEAEAFAKELLRQNPDAIPGWRLKPNASREPIRDVQTVYERFDKLGGSLEDFMKCVSVTKKTLTEQLRQLTGAKGQALEKVMDTLTAGTTETQPVEPSLERAG